MIRMHTRRVLCIAGGMLAVTALVTSAALTDEADVQVLLDGSDNTFDIQTAAAPISEWDIHAASWEQGNPDAYEIALGADASGAALPPGGSIALVIAVKNASPRLDGDIGLSVFDPDPLGDRTDPSTGAYLELFDQLRFTMRTGDTVIADGLTAEEFNELAFIWPESFAAGEAREVDVVISLPREVDNRWMGAGTRVQFAFEGENA